MAMTEKIRILLVKRGNLSEAELARRLEISPQNLHNKMKRDNFTESDLQKIVKDQTGLNLDYKNSKIITTPLFGAGVKIDDVTVKLDDGSLVKLDKGSKASASSNGTESFRSKYSRT